MPVTTLPGVLTQFDWRGHTVRFFARDLADPTQSVHTNFAFYEERELALLEQHAPPGGVFLDIGSGVGNYPVYMARFCAPREMILIEPRTDLAVTLRLNLLLNRIGANLTHLEAVLSDGAGPGEVAGDSLFAGQAIDFIRIDAPGRELAILQGLDATIARSRPAVFLRVGHARADGFDRWLARHGYEIAGDLRRFADNKAVMAIPLAGGSGPAR